MNSVIYDRASPLEIYTLSTAINFHRRSTTQTSIFKETIVTQTLKLVQLPRNEKSDSLRGAVLSIHNWKRFSSKFVLHTIHIFIHEPITEEFNGKSVAEISNKVCYVFSSSLREKHEWCFVFFFLFKNQNACTLRLQLNIWEKLIACDCFKCFHGSLAFLFFSQKSEMTEKYFLRKILIQFNRVNLWLERLVGILVRLRYWENPQILSF